MSPASREKQQRRRVRPRALRPRSFTLAEMLVVTAAILVLASILVPSLKGAREQALRVRCAANLHALGQAAAMYHARYAEWLPGSPGTSGGELLGRYGGSPGQREDMPVTPVQTWDWAGPLAVEFMGMSLPPQRPERFAVLTGGVFACPANRNLSVPFLKMIGEVGRFRVQPATSYVAGRNFLMWPKVERDGQPWGPVPPFYADGNPAGWDGNIDGASGAVLPATFVPKLTKVGAPANKVFLADASRFTSWQGLSHNIHWRGADVGGAAGAAFADGGPTLRDDLLRSYWREDPQRSYGYRHARGREVGASAVYFDGHATWLSEKASRSPFAWWPKEASVPIAEFNAPTRAGLSLAAGQTVLAISQ